MTMPETTTTATGTTRPPGRPNTPELRTSRRAPGSDEPHRAWTSSLAAEYLLTQPDAYLYRRRYLDLITQTPGPDGTSITDYAAAERYLLVTATAHRRTHSEVRPLPAPGDFL